MKDRVSLYPGRVTLTPVSGQTNTYDMVRADEPTQEGTPLNKATLLKDTTAALYGLGADATPDEALGVLSRFQSELGNEYLWSIPTESLVITETDVSVRSIFSSGSADGSVTFYYSDSLNIDGSLKDYQSVTISYNTYENANVLKGNYFRGGSSTSQLRFCPSDADDATQQMISTSYAVSIPYSVVSTAIKTTYRYVNSPDPNAYPPAEDDGLTYIPLGALGENIRFAAGSYVGTGTYGSDNPTLLSFLFAPDVVFISCMGNPTGSLIGMLVPNKNKALESSYFMRGVAFAGSGDGMNPYVVYVRLTGTTLSFYGLLSSPGYSFNAASVEYRYFAIAGN